MALIIRRLLILNATSVDGTFSFIHKLPRHKRVDSDPQLITVPTGDMNRQLLIIDGPEWR